MIDLRHKKQRIVQSLDNYRPLYQSTWSPERNKLSYTAGVLNSIWNIWNNFWREYWISHTIGGLYVNGSPIIPIQANYSKGQAIFFLLIKIGKLKQSRLGDSITGTHQEPTWGDIIIIEKLAIELLQFHPHLQQLLNLIGYYRLQVKHFQQIRNSFIHLNNENISKLNNIQSRYVFNSSQKLINILEANKLGSNETCFEDLVDNMKGLVLNM